MLPISSAKLGYINAVRGIAITMVLLLHVAQSVPGLPDTFTYMSSKGSFGVQLFFIASAFTLFLSYSKKSLADGIYTKRNFFIRRFFRISPMYYLAALIYGIISYYYPYYNDGQPLSIPKVLINLLYLNTFIPGAVNYLPPGGWSVGAEMVFYCFVPFVFTRIKSLKAAVWLFLAMAAGGIILQYTIRLVLTNMHIDYKTPETWFLYYWFPNQVSIFALGIVLFFIIGKYRIKSKQVASLLLAATICLMLLFNYFGRVIVPYMIVQEHVVMSLFFMVIVYLLSQYRFILFDNRVFHFLGEISFSLYLVHFLVVKFFEQALPGSITGFERYFILAALTFGIGSLVSWVTYRTIECRGIEWGNRLIKKEKKQQASVILVPSMAKAVAAQTVE